MKTRTQILELTQKDLADLLTTATYGSNWLSISTPNGNYKGTPLEDPQDWLEDKWAKVLLAGKNIFAHDWFAQDETEYYGNLVHVWCEEDMRYTLSLPVIMRGLSKAADSGSAYARKCYHDFVNRDDEGCFDISSAEELMQWIIFGEPIYG